MIRILYRNGKLPIRTDVAVADLPAVLAECQGKEGLIWVDLHQEQRDETSSDYQAERAEFLRILKDVFGFHPLAIDDALAETLLPKLDDWDTYVYLTLHAVVFDTNLDDVDTREVDIFLGRNYVVTHHTEPVPALEREARAILRDDRHTRRGPDYLVYELCDAIASDYLPCIDAIDEALDRIQDEMFERPAPGILERAFKVKRAVSHLRRVLSPQREVLNRLARDDYDVIDERERIYFRNVYDHYVRMADLNESLRDLAQGALDSYLSITANRTNQVMKALTIITVLFMPLTFVTGFFGMNFFGGGTEVRIDWWNPAIAFSLAVTMMIAIPLGMIIFIRRRGWW